MELEFDDIVVGAGSSGSIVAARLHEDPSRKVLLIEAGKNYLGIDGYYPEELSDPSRPITNGYNWDFKAIVRLQSAHAAFKHAHNVFWSSDHKDKINLAKTALKSVLYGDDTITKFDYPVGKLVGGSSAINGALAMRPTPTDFDEWAGFGLKSWAWSSLMPWFKKIETDMDMRGPYFGNSGPIPISRPKMNELHSVQKSFLDICVANGFPIGEFNNPNSTGVGLVPRNIRQGKRISSARAYTEYLNGKNSLTIFSDTLVEKILFSGEKASGLTVIRNGMPQTLKAKRVILCAGAINTPLILQRSGVGNATQLQAHDIEVTNHLPGVGQNLIDQSAVGLWAIPNDGLCKLGEDIHQVMLRYTAPGSEYKNDMSLFMLNSVYTKQFPELYTALGSEIALSISAVLGKPDSRGFIELTGKDSNSRPLICFNYASEASDRARLMDGVRLAWKFLQHENLKRTYKKIFAWNQRIIESDKLLEESILTFVRGSWHAAGTAKMGVETDTQAVVNQYGKVYGRKNLYVCDASIMPSIPSVPPNLTCMVMAEYLSQNIRAAAYEN